MWAMVCSFGLADPADAPVGLLGGFAQFAVGGLLVRGDHSPADVSLVGDPSGGVQPVEQSGRRLVWASDPYPGSMHDAAALDASGLLDGIDPSGWIADKGYIGRGMITPHKKPPNGELSEAAEEANKSISRIRRAERAHHRPHQALENPPHRLPPPPAHIRTDHHRRTLTLRLQKHPLNKLPGKKDLSFKSAADAGKSILNHFKEFGGNGLIQLDRLTYLRMALPFIRTEG